MCILCLLASTWWAVLLKKFIYIYIYIFKGQGYIIYAVKKFRGYYIFNGVNLVNIIKKKLNYIMIISIFFFFFRIFSTFSNILSVLMFSELQHINTKITYKATNLSQHKPVEEKGKKVR